MKNKIIKHIETLIKEHKESGFCTDWNKAFEEDDTEQALHYAHDCGQYSILNQLLDDIEQIERVENERNQN